MLAARITFGRRSFHAAANPTAGGVVSTGPYAYIRHPIYAAAIYFTWAGALDHLSGMSLCWAVLLTAGAFTRMLIEERMLVERYPEYREYQARTRRVLPFVV
jgi:protein-S-isoprenylcysteine O-methyltransferase Ste14